EAAAVEELLEADIGALFMPHGLGHFLGLDTHDVGGYCSSPSPSSSTTSPPTSSTTCPPRPARPGFNRLRTNRTLQAGMVITVEPGCYFNPALLLPALEDKVKSRYLVRDAILAHMDMGGVRLEDNVVVTESGAESLTHVPRTPEEIETVMKGGAWP
ncbi:hypothetical protein Agub_g12433, partial [Astrephomene gubernaculifera]